MINGHGGATGGITSDVLWLSKGNYDCRQLGIYFKIGGRKDVQYYKHKKVINV